MHSISVNFSITIEFGRWLRSAHREVEFDSPALRLHQQNSLLLSVFTATVNKKKKHSMNPLASHTVLLPGAAEEAQTTAFIYANNIF